ncbi:MAG: 3-phosphoshikimate 1-carboxyvinyltransferase [Angelakisella sp.]
MDIITKKSKLSGTAIVPGSKSHTIRAVLLAAMAEGTSRIHNPLPSLDCQSAMSVAEAFGAKTTIEPGLWTVEGCGNNLKVPENYVDCGNSGSTAYFAASMAGLVDGYTVLTGDAQIRRRPVQPVLDAICQMGGKAFTSRPGVDACPAIIGGKMAGGKVHFNKSLSQFVSSVMLSAPLLENDTEIFNENPLEKPYLQLSVDWMKRYGVELAENSGDYTYFKIKGGQVYHATETSIPSDWSGVAFPLVAGLVTPSQITITGVDMNDSQGDKAVVDHLIAMGADIVKDAANNQLIVTGGKPLTSGLTIDLSDIPDSLPALSVAAAYAQGDTKFTGLAHVRLKETDRVAVMESELTKVGASVETGPDYMIVHGGATLTGTTVDSYDDHRVAMAMAVCGMFAEGEMTIKDGECAAVSFPTFFEVMENLGAVIIKKTT